MCAQLDKQVCSSDIAILYVQSTTCRDGSTPPSLPLPQHGSIATGWVGIYSCDAFHIHYISDFDSVVFIKVILVTWFHDYISECYTYIQVVLWDEINWTSEKKYVAAFLKICLRNCEYVINRNLRHAIRKKYKYIIQILVVIHFWLYENRKCNYEIFIDREKNIWKLQCIKEGIYLNKI